MKKSYLYLTICAGLAAVSSQAQTPSQPRVFAALAMTKAQESSPIPTDSGVFLYDQDSGEWQRSGPVIQITSSIAIDPSDPNNMFLACGNGIVRSLDGGETWRMTSGWRESDFTKIAIDPSNGKNVYAASVWGVSVSRDGGDSWTAANNGLPEKYSKTIIVDHLKPKRILLGTADGIYVSNDRANTWKPIRSSPKLVILRIDRSGANPDLWIAGTEGQGVYLSTNDAKTWVAAAPQLADKNIYAVAADPHNAANLAAAGWGTGVWVSSDGGDTWIDRGKGLPSQNVTSMTYDVNNSGRLWVSTFEEGTMYSNDQGQSWQDGGLHGAYVTDLGIVSVKQN